jgi:asparagine synthase (glutamine-hydrolysing)
VCGIAGIVNLRGHPPQLDELDAMADALLHRGPDSHGTLIGEGVGLIMRRLSIIDLDSGSQPIGNEDGTIWTVFNGEIYNHRELRQELEQKGHHFRTRSDTEVIVHLYEELGERCVERMRGMFAFAVWDNREQTILLARDRLGIKPLYYRIRDGRLVFASELKSILSIPGISRELDRAAVDHFFAGMCTPSAQSIVAGISKLEPGSLLTASLGRPPRISRYWTFRPTPDRTRPESYFVERLRELLEESVRLHMLSDVPVGAFLSGGLDSSAVVATMARLASGPLKTFCIRFREPRYDESKHARLVAARFGAEHHELVLEPDIASIVEKLTWHMDEPFGDASAIPTFMVSYLASQHVKVVLSGDGGDELFGGYDRYLVERHERRYRIIPRALRRGLGAMGVRLPAAVRGRGFLQHLALDHPERYLDATTLFRRADREQLLRDSLGGPLGPDTARADEADFLRCCNGHWLTSLQALDLNFYLPLDILTKLDRMSMAHSIEARVPLLDHILVEFAASIPPELNLKGTTTKYAFRRAMAGILPPSILGRGKRGFAVPLDRWFRGPLREFARELLLSATTRQRGVFEPAFVARLVERQQSGQELGLQLWSLISFELWCRLFLDRSVKPFRRAPGASADDVVMLPHAGRPRMHAGCLAGG